MWESCHLRRQAFRFCLRWCRNTRNVVFEGETVTEKSLALQTALAYHEAWTSKNLDLAMSYIAEDIVCDAPAGRIEGADAYRAFMAPFVQTLRGAAMIAAFGDDETA